MIAALLLAALASPLDVATWAPPPNARVPLALQFRDETAKPLRLADLPHHPHLLVLGYHACTNLCGPTLDGLAASLSDHDLDVLAVSVDPRETPADAAARKQRYRGRPGVRDWHFLVADAPTIARLTTAVGFHYAPDGRQLAHPAGIVVLASDGRVSRYLGGVEFAPATLSAAIAQARAGETHASLPEVLLRCFHYDPAAAGAHDGQVLLAIRLGGGAVVAGLVALVALLVRRDRRARPWRS